VNSLEGSLELWYVTSAASFIRTILYFVEFARNIHNARSVENQKPEAVQNTNSFLSSNRRLLFPPASRTSWIENTL